MKKQLLTAVLIFSAVSAAVPAFAAPQSAPAHLQAALILKLLPYYGNLGDKQITIHVVGADDVAEQLKSSLGKALGKATLVNVTTGDTPVDGAAVVYVGKNAADNISWTQAHQALSITGNPDLVTQGVTLGIGLENAKPKIFLNLTSSKAEGADWNPAILKVAETMS